MREQNDWIGTATDVLVELGAKVGKLEAKRKDWSGSAAAVGRRLKRLTTPLRRIGVVDKARDGGAKGKREIMIKRVVEEQDPANGSGFPDFPHWRRCINSMPNREQESRHR